MTQHSSNDAQQLAQAIQCCQTGHLHWAELLARDLTQRLPHDPANWAALGDVARHLNLPKFATQFYERALHLDPQCQAALQGQQATQSIAGPPPRQPPQFMLIKAWGCGFWSDVNHVLSSLLAAEMTGRTPIIHWGSNSLFGRGDSTDAWRLYFEPVSDYTLSDAQHEDLTFYPTKWNCANLAQNDVAKWAGAGSRISALYFLARSENVLVSDFYTGVIDLLPWVEPGGPYAGLGVLEVYRRLAARYLKPQPSIQQAVQDFWGHHMQGHHWLAVHARGSDKILEVAQLEQLNQAYFGHVDQLLHLQPQAKIFLITDSQLLLASFQQRYANKVLTTSCLRSANEVGVHYSGYAGEQVGSEVLLDTLLAAQCHFFLGNASSNVSLAVRYLKTWPFGHCMLLGTDMHAQRNTFLHDPRNGS